MTYSEKKQTRIERYESLAEKAQERSNELCEKSRKMVECIPFGQPIHVGHYSERADRNLRQKSWDMIGKSVKEQEKAEYYSQKAEATAKNNAIYFGDNASEKLADKVEKLEKLQETMKSANKIIRKKISDIEKIELLEELGFSKKQSIEIMTPDYCGRIGFASFQLSNNNASLKEAKKRLEKAQKLETTENREYLIGQTKVVENCAENRIQVFFDGKPDENTRSSLKRSGFRWAPSNGCWQSYINRRSIDAIKSILAQ